MEQGNTRLMVETQNVNVPACRFYRAMGCELGEIDRYGYWGAAEVDVTQEVMLLWYLDLTRNGAFEGKHSDALDGGIHTPGWG